MDTKVLIENIFNFARNSEDLILIIDNMGKIFFINNSFLQLLPEKKPGLRDIENFILTDSINKKMAFQVASVLRKPVQKTFKKELGISVGKEKRSYEIKITSFKKDNNFIGNLVIFKDVTEYKKLIESLNDQSIKDFLTGIYNQRYFYYSLYKEIKRFNRYKRPLSLLMMDIDNFKKFNDLHGHLKGDWLLKETARILKESIRDGIDSVSRYGGDEFVVILVDADEEKAASVANRIEEKFNELDNEGTSLSIGLCQYRAGMSADTLIKKADSMMYQEKRSSKQHYNSDKTI